MRENTFLIFTPASSPRHTPLFQPFRGCQRCLCKVVFMEVWLNPVRSASRNDLLILLSFFHSSLFLAYRILPFFFTLIVNPHPLLHFILHFIVSLLFFFLLPRMLQPPVFFSHLQFLSRYPPVCFITSVCTCIKKKKKQ